ncbi:superoxide dismutase [Cu-Zn] SodC [Halomonas sp. AOP12-C2-37]|uniref:Superoxide dismutase [Cu-Zn] n=1 Tax=Halomonas casei TaxID=2742613 RepID=A0ABR9F0A3_9GAMM|nr:MULTISPECIES: superoxide dismutase family protein [Halomonas]MBE0399789.1 superoxide dismutase family protein [Halomonas casei]PCC23650.1 superoxide dismutase [Halomonas sp. JB37]
MRYIASLTGIAASLLLASTAAQANETLDVEMHKVSVDGVEESIGTVSLESTEHGLLLTPSLTDMEPGVYGFHVHQNASCDPAENDDGEMTAAQAAGGHYDPEETDTHLGPYGEGHLGDLPVLTVNEDGEANLPVLAPRLSMEDMPGRSIMIHAGGDTYKDEPHLGGGGARMACGVVES